MASWQAHLANLVLRVRVKRRLVKAGATEDVAAARAVLNEFEPKLRKDVRVTPAALGDVPGEWLATEKGADGPVLLYLHGGGYFACSPATHRAITAFFARRGFRVFAPDYRLAPEHPFPAAVEDALHVWRALHGQAGGAPIAVAGESAGGGLALAMMLALRDIGQPLPKAAALFSPWTDLAATGASLLGNDRWDPMFRGALMSITAQRYLAGADPHHPLASPLYGDLAGLPPLLLHVGRREVLLDDSVRLAERARAAGVPVDFTVWPVVPHAWQIFGGAMPEARASLGQASDFLKSKLSP